MHSKSLAAVLLLAAPALAEMDRPAEFALTIDPAAVPTPWPILAPLPFPSGTLTDTEQIRIVDRHGEEVPAQVDAVARYRDGSLRWVHAAFTALPDGEYRVQFGDRVRRVATDPGLAIDTQPDGTRIIDTGAARFTLRPDALLFDRVEIRDGDAFRPIVQDSGHGAYLIDNQNRLARAAGPASGMETEVLRSGPQRAVIRTRGWYVTPDGERVARGVLRMTFHAHSAAVKATHTLIFTEDTNRVWIRDYGIETQLAAVQAETAAFAPERSDNAVVGPLHPLAEGDTALVLQETFPHFAERDSRFLLAVGPAESPRTVREGPAAGDWMDAAGAGFGLTVVVPDLAEQFPKELEARTDRVRIGLWPRRCGRELDFRAETLVREYWKDWADLAPGGAAAAAQWESNAQGAAKTHDLWWLFRPHPGRSDVPAAAGLAARGVRALPAPAWSTASRAIGWPLHPHDPNRFPREEGLIEDFWERTVLPLEIFPMTGVIAWGSHPYLGYSRRDGRYLARHFRLSRLIDYGMKRYAWGLYLRSGDRRYHDYGRRFNRFAADGSQFNWDAEPNRKRGAFVAADTHRPLYWHGGSELLSTSNSGYDIQHWILDYWLTGDERSLEAARNFGEAVREHWDRDAAAGGASPFMILRVLTSLYALDGDEDFRQMAHDLLRAIVDLDLPHPFVLRSPLYKIERNAMALYDYYTATGDELAREALIKAMDYQWRFNRLTGPISYQNGLAYLFTILWEWTGEPRYLAAIRRLVDAHADVESVSLAEERDALAEPVADSDQFGRLRRGPHLNMHPLLGMPTALTTMERLSGLPPFPVLMKAETVEPAAVVFRKPDGEPVRMSFYYRTLRAGEVRPQIRMLHADGTPGDTVNAEMTVERRMDYHSEYQYSHFHANIRIPGDVPPGLYTLDTGGPEEMIVVESSVPEVALYCPDGFWAPGHGWMWNLQRGIASGLPMYFHVPDDLEELHLFLGRPFEVRRPDGTVAWAAEEEGIGEVRIPVGGQGGPWSVVGLQPGNVKLRNVVPLVAMGSPESLITLPAARPPPPSPGPLFEADAPFVQTDRGPALLLAGGKRLSFDRGEPHPDGGWAHFPGDEGTIEFWYLPHMSDNERALPHRGTNELAFLTAGSVDIQHRYGPGPRANLLYGYLDLRMRGTLGEGNRAERADAVGIPARLFFRAGEWVHIAVTWRLRPDDRGTGDELRVFIDGIPQRSAWSWPARLTGRAPFRLDEADEQIHIGPADGALRDLRISDVVRYEAPFTPAADLPETDARTRILFPLRHDLADSKVAAEARTIPE